MGRALTSSWVLLISLLLVTLVLAFFTGEALRKGSSGGGGGSKISAASRKLKDITPDGKCAKDVAVFCKDVTPGEQKLLGCLTNQLEHGSLSRIAPEDAKPLSDECKGELRSFRIALYEDMSMDTKMAKSCKADIATFCEDDFLYPGHGNVLACLREIKQVGKLSDGCNGQVLKAQIAAANDFALDPQLNEICSSEANRLCKGVEPGEGRVQECLRSKMIPLAWDCEAELFRQEVENADDIRLNVRLSNACLDDTKKFCSDVVPGEARVQDCLESHREAPDFTRECNAEMTRTMERRARDFRLDPSLRKHCRQDIAEVCRNVTEEIIDVADWDGKVTECLQENREDVRDPQCRQQVQEVSRRAAENIGFDPALALACHGALISSCKDAPRELSQAFACLQEHRLVLDESCRDMLFKREVWYAADVTFKVGMRRACQEETSKLCGGIEPQQGDVIRCLQEHHDDVDMGETCRGEVQKDQKHRATEFPTSYKLNRRCFEEAQQLCGHECDKQMSQERCGGAMLPCLSAHFRQLNSTACKHEVFYFKQREQAGVSL